MAAPEVTAAVDELYEALDPALTVGDEDRGYATLHLCAAIAEGNLAFIHLLVTEDEAPGWQILLDPDRCPAIALPYLAQFVGAVLTPDMDEQTRRDAIKAPEGFGRGTPEAIEATARRRLTGTKTVLLDERYEGDAWQMRLRTFSIETPDPAVTEAEIRAEQKPIGIVLTYKAITGQDWADLRADHATWADVVADYATWFETRTDLP